jgi:hypothetical protein
MDARELRRKQLEEKKRQLAELRARKRASAAEATAAPSAVGSDTSAASPSPLQGPTSDSTATASSSTSSPDVVDELLADLLKKKPVDDKQPQDVDTSDSNPAADAAPAFQQRAPVMLSVVRAN